jgi:hypothetical protein
MKFLKTVEVGQRIRMRIGRRWYSGCVVDVGTDYGGVPTARVAADGERRQTRCEFIHKLRAEREEV